MNQAMFRKLLFAVMFAAGGVLLIGIQPLSLGQEAKEKKAKGRLPAYYADIVTEKQRTEIYAIQDKYAKEIAGLNEQLGAVTKKRDGEIEKLLNAEQKEKLKKSQDEAAAKKEEGRSGQEKRPTNRSPRRKHRPVPRRLNRRPRLKHPGCSQQPGCSRIAISQGAARGGLDSWPKK